MQANTEKTLVPSQRLDILLALFNRQSLRPLLNELKVPQLVEAHAFLWDKLVEIHYLTQSDDFRREHVTAKMKRSADYQQEQGCDLRLDYCKGVECIWSNPECAGNKVKNNMEVMADAIIGYIADCSQAEAKVVQSRVWD